MRSKTEPECCGSGSVCSAHDHGDQLYGLQQAEGVSDTGACATLGPNDTGWTLNGGACGVASPNNPKRQAVS